MLTAYRSLLTVPHLPQEFLKVFAIKLSSFAVGRLRPPESPNLFGFWRKAHFDGRSRSDWRGPRVNTMLLIDSPLDLDMIKLDLIADKISPRATAPRISRRRLIKTLEQSVASGNATIVCGRAGTGKTTLALDFANKCCRRFAWYKIDAPETDPLLFFRYLISSIQQCRAAFSINSLHSIEISADDMSWLAEAFVYELAESEGAGPLLIVIEDLHLVSDAEWLVPFFSRFLSLLPADVHLLITSRNLPPAPLWRLRSKQTLVVIDEPALAFSNPEAVTLFQTYGLSPKQASIAWDHTHGRAAALDESAVFLSREKASSTETKPEIDLSPTLDGATVS